MSAHRTHAPVSRFLALALLTALALLGATAGAAGAAPAAPAWKMTLVPMPTNFAPGVTGDTGRGPMFLVAATNVGEAAAAAPITITDTLPAGLTPTELDPGCSAAGQTVTCTFSETIYPGEDYSRRFGVAVAPGLEDPSTLINEATVSGGGSSPVTTRVTTPIGSEEAPYDFLPGAAGLDASLVEADGSPATTAAGHPNWLTVGLNFSSVPGNYGLGNVGIFGSGGGTRDIRTYLPPGLVVNPSAAPVRCTEAQFESYTCPDASQVGTANPTIGALGEPLFFPDPIYNLVPPPGSPVSFGFDAGNAGIFIHILGGLRPGDYRLAAFTNDILAVGLHPLMGAQVQLWGDPSSPSHDHKRGQCGPTATCPVAPQDAPLLTTPTSCTDSIAVAAEARSWAAPANWHTRSAPFTDLEGGETGVSGCNAVPFKPSLSAQPTTNLADSPSGLDVDLRIPQSESLKTAASAHLKAATVTLPEGLVVNPSSANGLAGCTPAQVGIDAATGLANGAPVSCPSAAKIGTAEIESSLLAQYDAEEKIQHDAEGHVLAEPIPGSVYIASPHDNPFGSLLAIYLVIEDPAHGILVKLAGKVTPDPVTGKLTTTFADNPQLPFEHFKLHFFGGAGAALRTPLTCGTKTISSTLTPWSSPEGADATPSDSFQTTATPAPGACPSSAGAAVNTPSFNAGTISPQAGAYSPLVLKLAREDGTAPIAAIDTTLPPGLTGKLAGIAYCPEAALAAAATKSGSQEKQSPSCPAASEVGSVVVGAGAGPTPYYTSGRAYLSGPYKGAPLSLAIITPATAGPYDLGTVVVRTALQVDPETARIRAVSDPIPQILAGIPLDVRSIALRMDRPNFTLNPTSCDPMALIGSATSPSGSLAPLKSPFQVGGCSALAFKPKLALSLKGGTKRGDNPALKAVLTYPKPPYANIAKASVALPHSEFLDQSHIKTICTRVQFAVNACPPGSVYGKATAITPLLDAPLSGPVYLRSSSHPLPDLVADLNGQIHVVLVGRIDSVKGGIRNTFEAVPDAPVSKFVLEMQGGKKGLLENSTNLCTSTNRATALFDAQNGKTADSTPKLAVKCPKGKGGKGRSRG